MFFGEEGHGLVGMFQRNEYRRYSQEIRRRRGRVFVLTGTASVFRASALAMVAAARGIYIPGEPGQVYDTAALTEDNELTIALKSLGATMVSPSECTVTTELMPDARHLWRQRLRWQRGALENISAYGVTTATSRYWGQQVGIAYGTVALVSYFVLMTVTLLAFDEWVWFPFWLVVGVVLRVRAGRHGLARGLGGAPARPASCSRSCSTTCSCSRCSCARCSTSCCAAGPAGATCAMPTRRGEATGG